MIRTIYLLTLKNDSQWYDLNSAKTAADLKSSFLSSVATDLMEDKVSSSKQSIIRKSSWWIDDIPLHITSFVWSDMILSNGWVETGSEAFKWVQSLTSTIMWSKDIKLPSVGCTCIKLPTSGLLLVVWYKIGAMPSNDCGRQIVIRAVTVSMDTWQSQCRVGGSWVWNTQLHSSTEYGQFFLVDGIVFRSLFYK